MAQLAGTCGAQVFGNVRVAVVSVPQAGSTRPPASLDKGQVCPSATSDGRNTGQRDGMPRSKEPETVVENQAMPS